MVSKEDEPEKGSVQFLAIHVSKGKEFDHVILIGMANDELPSFQSLKKGTDSTEWGRTQKLFCSDYKGEKVLYVTY